MVIGNWDSGIWSADLLQPISLSKTTSKPPFLEGVDDEE